jgi:hypothetical protein
MVGTKEGLEAATHVYEAGPLPTRFRYFPGGKATTNAILRRFTPDRLGDGGQGILKYAGRTKRFILLRAANTLLVADITRPPSSPLP